MGVPDEPPQPPARPRDRDDVRDGEPGLRFVSSSGVKEIASFGGRVDELVPKAVARSASASCTRTVAPGAPVSPQE